MQYHIILFLSLYITVYLQSASEHSAAVAGAWGCSGCSQVGAPGQSTYAIIWISGVMTLRYQVLVNAEIP
jgi:hypothetical protein